MPVAWSWLKKKITLDKEREKNKIRKYTKNIQVHFAAFPLGGFNREVGFLSGAFNSSLSIASWRYLTNSSCSLEVTKSGLPIVTFSIPISDPSGDWQSYLAFEI